MQVFIITQTWQTPYDPAETAIMGVYDSLEKARFRLKECYKEDIDWLKERGIEEKDFDESELKERSSFVQYDEYWCDNSIVEETVI